MKPEDLFNTRKEDFETVEGFAQRIYDTVKRVSKNSFHLTPSEGWEVISSLGKYYHENNNNILDAIRSFEGVTPSVKYRIQWVKVLADHYLVVEKR